MELTNIYKYKRYFQKMSMEKFCYNVCSFLLLLFSTFIDNIGGYDWVILLKNDWTRERKKMKTMQNIDGYDWVILLRNDWKS